MHAIHQQHGTPPMTARLSEASTIETADYLSNLLAQVANKQCRVSFSLLFQHFAPRLQAYATSKFGNSQLAADLVQDTMTNVWQKAHLFHPERGTVSTWVFTIARNAGFDYLRKNKHHLAELSADELWPILSESNEAAGVSDTLDNQLLMKQINSHAQHLPEDQRVVIEQLYHHGKSQQEVSTALDIPLGTVKSRARLALQKLREMINND